MTAEIKKLKILCSAMDSQGHVNAILGFSKMLKTRGHHVIVTLAPGWKSLVEKHGYEFIPMQLDSDTPLEAGDQNNGGDGVGGKTEAPNQKLIDTIANVLKTVRMKPMEYVHSEGDDCDTWISWHDKQFPSADALGKVIETIKPDMIVVDYLLRVPCLEKSKIPWAQLWSCNPIVLYSGHCPPQTTGFPTDSPKQLWDEYKILSDRKFEKLFNYIRSWLSGRGIEDHESHLAVAPFMISQSNWINFYTYPGFLDYDDIGPKLGKWVRMDTSVREPDDETPFQMPESLIDKPGKLIYFSLGTMGSVDLELMRRVISVCAKSPNRFIVSKGPLYEQIDLPDNMWGDKYVNQIAILPHCDLVITHGGNNTLTESFHFGKPVIVLPIIYDQADNAQRVVEKGVGLRIDTYHFEDHELLEAIEKLINDEQLKEKLKTFSSELKASTIKTKENVCKLIEKTVSLGKSPFDVIVD